MEATKSVHYCEVCSLYFNSNLEIFEHKLTQQHHKKLEEKSSSIGHHCDLCNKEFPNLLLFTQHIDSEGHRQKLQKNRQSQFSRANTWYQTRPAYSNIISRSLSGLKDTAKQRSSLTEPLLFSPGSLPKKRRGSKCIETPHIVVPSMKSYSGQNTTTQASSHPTLILIPSRPLDKHTDKVVPTLSVCLSSTPNVSQIDFTNDIQVSSFTSKTQPSPSLPDFLPLTKESTIGNISQSTNSSMVSSHSMVRRPIHASQGHPNPKRKSLDSPTHHKVNDLPQHSGVSSHIKDYNIPKQQQSKKGKWTSIGSHQFRHINRSDQNVKLQVLSHAITQGAKEKNKEDLKKKIQALAEMGLQHKKGHRPIKPKKSIVTGRESLVPPMKSTGKTSLMSFDVRKNSDVCNSSSAAGNKLDPSHTNESPPCDRHRLCTPTKGSHSTDTTTSVSSSSVTSSVTMETTSTTGSDPVTPPTIPFNTDIPSSLYTTIHNTGTMTTYTIVSDKEKSSEDPYATTKDWLYEPMTPSKSNKDGIETDHVPLPPDDSRLIFLEEAQNKESSDMDISADDDKQCQDETVAMETNDDMTILTSGVFTAVSNNTIGAADKGSETVSERFETVCRKSEAVDPQSEIIPGKGSEIVSEECEAVDEISKIVDRTSETTEKRSEIVAAKGSETVNKRPEIVADKEFETIVKKSVIVADEESKAVREESVAVDQRSEIVAGKESETEDKRPIIVADKGSETVDQRSETEDQRSEIVAGKGSETEDKRPIIVADKGSETVDQRSETEDKRPVIVAGKGSETVDKRSETEVDKRSETVNTEAIIMVPEVVDKEAVDKTTEVPSKVLDEETGTEVVDKGSDNVTQVLSSLLSKYVETIMLEQHGHVRDSEAIEKNSLKRKHSLSDDANSTKKLKIASLDLPVQTYSIDVPVTGTEGTIILPFQVPIGSNTASPVDSAPEISKPMTQMENGNLSSTSSLSANVLTHSSIAPQLDSAKQLLTNDYPSLSTTKLSSSLTDSIIKPLPVPEIDTTDLVQKILRGAKELETIDLQIQEQLLENSIISGSDNQRASSSMSLSPPKSSKKASSKRSNTPVIKVGVDVAASSLPFTVSSDSFQGISSKNSVLESSDVLTQQHHSNPESLAKDSTEREIEVSMSPVMIPSPEPMSPKVLCCFRHKTGQECQRPVLGASRMCADHQEVVEIIKDRLNLNLLPLNLSPETVTPEILPVSEPMEIPQTTSTDTASPPLSTTPLKMELKSLNKKEELVQTALMETESELNGIVEEIENLQERLSQLQPKKDSLMKKCEELTRQYQVILSQKQSLLFSKCVSKYVPQLVKKRDTSPVQTPSHTVPDLNASTLTSSSSSVSPTPVETTESTLPQTEQTEKVEQTGVPSLKQDRSSVDSLLNEEPMDEVLTDQFTTPIENDSTLVQGHQQETCYSSSVKEEVPLTAPNDNQNHSLSNPPDYIPFLIKVKTEKEDPLITHGSTLSGPKITASGTGSAPVSEHNQIPSQRTTDVSHQCFEVSSSDQPQEKKPSVKPPDIIHFEPHGSSVLSMKVYGGELYTTSSDKTTKAYDIQTGKCLRRYVEHQKSVTCLEIYNGSDGCTYLLSGSSDKFIHMQSVKTGKIVCKFKCTTRVMYLAVCGQLLYVAQHSGTLAVIDLEQKYLLGKQSCHDSGKAISCIAATPTHLFTASFDFTVACWNVTELSTTKTWMNLTKLHQLTTFGNTVLCILVNDNFLFCGSADKTVQIFDIKTWDRVHVLSCHNGAVSGIQIMGKILVTACFDKFIRCFDLEKLELLQVYGGHSDLIFSLSTHNGVMYTGCRDGSINAFRLDLTVFYECKWSGCGLRFGIFQHLHDHLKVHSVSSKHQSSAAAPSQCQWEGCKSQAEPIFKHIVLHLPLPKK